MSAGQIMSPRNVSPKVKIHVNPTPQNGGQNSQLPSNH